LSSHKAWLSPIPLVMAPWSPMMNVACIVFFTLGLLQSMAYWQPLSPGEYMSQCNIGPVGGGMIQSMAVWNSQQ
jgi:hypothetical protein